ncbi:hypothetical protein J2W40_000079 [Sphingobium xenophagum]|uniref:GSCFA domain-containing protein n=1 Tax=Sphingobium xenophagum TaxID=121428 RepID=A0ABU1WVD9_SPHXE|nr:GSCFA domain-containing protein [Sphingobium xenophagum]MDR7153285.1 hypothetical protein [Sphingobium xenophagum]
MSGNPYHGLQDHQFWRRAISRTESHAVDPVTRVKFQISQADRVATAGSCFAQHISRRLSGIGFNYFVPEDGASLSEVERRADGYGMFSARYGNIYTVRQLLQLFQEAYGDRVKSEAAWQRSDGRFVDPFRPVITPAGYESAEEVAKARKTHLASVRRVFNQARVFVFTLGLTESWIARDSGDVFPLAPGVSGGVFDEARYAFVNMRAMDVVADLTQFLGLLKLQNCDVKVILTVSPVPLIATYDDRHVLVSNTYSKSALRVAAEEVSALYDWVDYFPSFEIITGNFNGGRYFEDDLREVNAAGVSHAMRCFLDHYVENGTSSTPSVPPVNSDPVAAEAMLRRMEAVICDEEIIESSMGRS